ncbi:OmpA family protein [Glaciecola siphonariae]|uniref:OmpA family protein n=1 Tax=Glaciecola siphonariae TaxID=521012 RepID=A0ABV9LYN7_9ALTE
MKKLALATAILAACTTHAVTAQEAPPYENWVGGFAQYYNADADKPEPVGGLDEGKGFGAEMGFRFDPSWAIRFELGRVLIDNDDNNRSSLADDGTQLGADLMYFLEDDAAYLFGGIREQSLTDSYRMASLGLGKHWVTGENWRVITEAATYYDFGQGYNEFSLKLGLAYVFGLNNAAKSQPDTDGDGVYDAVDRCPNTPAGVRVDATGCNIDLDGDGVINSVDQCPRTPAGVAVDARGCAFKDSDGDGVLDNVDQCADTPSTDRVDEVGCSIFEETEIFVELDLLFANNSAVIDNPESEMITDFVDFMKRYPNTNASIEGHTSAVGTEAYNQALSQRRAEATRDMLINRYGIDASRLSAIGYGETRLKFTENTAEAHRLNRRIEAKITATVEEKLTR